ncbi:MAG: type IV pili twitching motility protein PilT [Candidatus Wallbacteria bacterium HGW-Wallbacteria-1]|jgi:twitching motility protein PilT|uniref:Type IV pili twitching motility protein PilT n=1 Tax=Candidatus Wallbacteria bacterium HGW-Wallbacteria-1 TaxID=2013854 RepID=A0A2N1PP83_9BACT|nr:MAG: type IV pili twitching motility protein PilT [Candidatus Wallbacteria bacterium HGW-Wallbacteria-1]
MDDILREILTVSIDMEASDVHLKVGYPPLFRVGGAFVSMDSPPLEKAGIWSIVTSIAGERRMARLRERLTLDMSFILPGLSRFRAHVFFQESNPGMVLRRIPLSPPQPRDLDLPLSVTQLFLEKAGLLLIAGPAGSGKSSTVASSLVTMGAKISRRVITIEDPIEYVFRDDKSFFIQREVGSDVTDFPSGLKAALRQDCDVIFIGDMRDTETARTALAAAETGHLVIATMATLNVEETLNLILNLQGAEYQHFALEQLASTLRGIVCQRLIPTRHGSTRKRMALAHEILIVNDAVRTVLRNGDFGQLQNLMEAGGSTGMTTFDRSLSLLLRNHQIPYSSAVAVARDPESFAKNHQNLNLGGEE